MGSLGFGTARLAVFAAGLLLLATVGDVSRSHTRPPEQHHEQCGKYRARELSHRQPSFAVNVGAILQKKKAKGKTKRLWVLSRARYKAIELPFR